MKDKAVFVVGVMRKDPSLQYPLTDVDIELLDKIADAANLDAQLVLAIPDSKYAGREKYVRMPQINERHPALLAEIAAHAPSMVFVFGVLAMKVILGSGKATLKHYRRRENIIEGIGAPVYVTDSLARYAIQPGVGRWLEKDVVAAVQGFNDTVYGEHTILLPDNLDWHLMPPEFIGKTTIGFDLETYPATHPWDDGSRIRMAILSADKGKAVVVQAGPSSELPDWVVELCADHGIVKAGSNIAFDAWWMHRFGYEVNNLHDTESVEHIIDCTDPNKNLKHLALNYEPKLGDYAREQDKVIKERGGWEYLLDEEMYPYAGCDGEASIAAVLGQYEAIKYNDLRQPYELYKDLYPVLSNMQIRGMVVDTDVTNHMDVDMQEKIKDLRYQIQAHLGPVNPASPTQLVKALMSECKTIDLRKQQWKKALEDEDEEASTCRAVLEREAGKHPVIPLVLEHRVWHKAHGSYIASFLRDKKKKKRHLRHHSGAWYVHPRYLPARTETFRLASADPNAQQMPRKGDEPRLNIKRQFISRFEGGQLLNADYAQMEMRIAAQESSDSSLLDAIAKEDIHRQTAAFMFRKDVRDVTDDERFAAKTIGFATIYGAGAGRISKMLGVSKIEASLLIGQYFRVYPGLRAHIDKVYSQVMVDLQVTTPFGFTRKFLRPPFDMWDKFDGARIKRQAYNTLIQSTAACVMYCALIEIEDALTAGGHKSLLIGTVHDSLMVDTFPGELDIVKDLVKDIMENPPTKIYGYELTVPLVVDLEVGDNWGSLEELV